MHTGESECQHYRTRMWQALGATWWKHAKEDNAGSTGCSGHGFMCLLLWYCLEHPAASVGSFAPVNPFRDGFAHSYCIWRTWPATKCARAKPSSFDTGSNSLQGSCQEDIPAHGIKKRKIWPMVAWWSKVLQKLILFTVLGHARCNLIGLNHKDVCQQHPKWSCVSSPPWPCSSPSSWWSGLAWLSCLGKPAKMECSCLNSVCTPLPGPSWPSWLSWPSWSSLTSQISWLPPRSLRYQPQEGPNPKLEAHALELVAVLAILVDTCTPRLQNDMDKLEKSQYRHSMTLPSWAYSLSWLWLRGCQWFQKLWVWVAWSC